MVALEELKALTRELSVLYVEDEPSIRNTIVEILGLFFKEIHAAENGVEGEALFERYGADLLITDIQMPRMNGLEMIARIRKRVPDLPVIITTAFGDQEYFIKSIDLKVDKYLLKPVEMDRVKEVLLSVARMIDDRRKAKELEILKMQERINRVSEQVLAQITDSYQNPCIVYTGTKMRYINDAFCALFDSEELGRFLEGSVALDALFDQRAGYLHKLAEYDQNDPAVNRVSVSRRKGRKIYRVSRRQVIIDENAGESEIYIFSDITLEEYQKIKIRSYNEILEELVIDARYRNRARSRAAEDVKPAEAAVKAPVPPEPEMFELWDETPEPAQKLVINEEENALLRRSHVHKTPASEYLGELDDEVLRELQELDELDRDFSESIQLLQEDANTEGVRQMSGQLDRYAHEISLLFEFEDLAYAIRSLSVLLASIDDSRLDEKRLRKVVVFLAGIQSDLADWRRLIFVDQSALDIHYLDSSLYSACLQIELVLSEEVKAMESEEDDLILF